MSVCAEGGSFEQSSEMSIEETNDFFYLEVLNVALSHPCDRDIRLPWMAVVSNMQE